MKTRNQNQIQGESDYSFVVISDTHIGAAVDTKYVTWLSHKAVEKINALVERENIKMVFLTGDITDSAMPEQWKHAREILDTLKVPYFPTLGNHDVWSYNNSAESTYEEPIPTGDAKFAKTFGDRFSSPNLKNATIVYNTEPCHNVDENITSWFQNWEMKYKSFVFYGLDWNTRMHAIPGYKGALPTARIHDYPCGTFTWLQNRLQKLPKNEDLQVIFLQHHPFEMPEFIPEFIYSFSSEKKQKIFQMLEDVGMSEKYWGVIAGHLHTWYNGTSGFKSSRQWLSEAVKLGSSFSLVNVKEGEVVKISKLFGFDY